MSIFTTDFLRSLSILFPEAAHRKRIDVHFAWPRTIKHGQVIKLTAVKGPPIARGHGTAAFGIARTDCPRLALLQLTPVLPRVEPMSMAE
ncbi:hypothetical protein RRG08_056027 [Elysia crispata]|uniref:Uncharacterized protein n=1 Tax=Elysia crispata TaxID=231223 RepID=A0AAE1DY34_9GAST|nr:hypothetical protein RRG08_056027 [Elysia crispata]